MPKHTQKDIEILLPVVDEFTRAAMRVCTGQPAVIVHACATMVEKKVRECLSPEQMALSSELCDTLTEWKDGRKTH